MISSPIDIVWKMFDNDQNGIKYSIKIFDRLECGRIDFGSINETTIAISSLTTENKIKWNGKTTSKISELTDGKYCLKICGAYKNNDSEYSMCRSQEIRINFKNKPPKFTSIPQSQINIISGSYWEFKISASDPENDKLTFRLIQSPPFLSINRDGLIKTNTGIWTIPSNVSNALYNVEIGVSDDINDEVKTSFRLNVEKRQGNLQNEPSTIQIEFPKANENVTLNNNEISFVAKDKEGIEKIIVEYSSDLQEWETIKSINKPTNDKLNIKWEINNIPDGEYYIRINVIDQQNILTTKVSDKFKLTKSESDKNEDININSVLFTAIYPEKNQKLKETPNQISFSIVVPDNFGAQLQLKEDTLKVEINEIDITSQCTIENLKVECTSISLNFGKHLIKVSIEDNQGKSYSDSWSFESEQTNEILNENTNLSASAIPIILAICGGVILVLFIPWALVKVIRKRNKNNDGDINNSEESYYTVPENMVTTVYNPEENKKDDLVDLQEIENLVNTNESLNNDQSIDAESISIEELEKLYPELIVNENTQINKPKDNN